MPYQFNNDGQPEAVEFAENFTDTREIRPAKHADPAPKREWRNAKIPAELRGDLARRFVAMVKKI